MDRKKKGLILTVIALLGLVVITAGVTYAFFNYTKQGTTDNTVTTGTITFLYTEVSGVGKGISIKEAYPVSDEVGKAQTGEGKVFDFKVTSTTPNKTNIPYEITARKKIVENMLDEKAVKMYLTKVSGDNEEEVLLDNYSNLTPTTKVDSSKYTEKILYTGKVTANSNKYEQLYRLRMWIDEETDFSYNEETGEYPYNDKTFTVTVNVYANAKVVTEEDVANESNVEISSVKIDETELTKVENKKYNYEMSLPAGTTETTIDIETQSPDATVKVERLDSLAYETSNIKRLSTKETLELNTGDNYFKVTVISENKQVEKEYIIRIYIGREYKGLAKLILDKNNIVNTTPNLKTSFSKSGNPAGLYKSTATNTNDETYYFRGNVTNNYVSFAGQTWRVVRINEDGTVRLIMQNGINNNTKYAFNPTATAVSYMYYTNSNVTNGAKKILDGWYQTNITNKGLDTKVAIGDYFCEQAKAKWASNYKSGSASMAVYTSYTPNFKCSKDGNGKGIVNSNVGLITYDETVHAGGYYGEDKNFYLYNNTMFWTMSPAGINESNNAAIWVVQGGSTFNVWSGYNIYTLRPVINLKADISVTGSGTSGDMFVVQ